MDNIILEMDIKSFVKGALITFWILGRKMIRENIMSQNKCAVPVKVPFEIVEMEIDKMFAEELADGESVDDRILKIEAYIKACGWELHAYESYKYYGELN